MQQMDYLYAGFRNAPLTLRENVLEHFSSLVTPENFDAVVNPEYFEAVVKLIDMCQLDDVRGLASVVRTGEDLARCSTLLEKSDNQNKIMQALKIHFLQKITPPPDNPTVEQLLISYSIASYYDSKDVVEETFTGLTVAIQTPEQLQTLWALLDTRPYHYLVDKECSFLRQLSKRIQLRPGLL